MSEELRTFLTIASVWFVSFIFVRFTIKVKNEANGRGNEIDEALSCFAQIFAPFSIILYPFIKFIAIPLFGVLCTLDKKAYEVFKRLILKLTK